MEGCVAVRGTSDGHASSCLATKITKITKSNSASKSNTVTPSTSKYIKASFQDFQVPMGEVQSEVLPPRCGVALGYPDSSSKLSDMATERRKLQEFCCIFPGFVARQGPTAGGVGFGYNIASRRKSCLSLRQLFSARSPLGLYS